MLLPLEVVTYFQYYRVGPAEQLGAFGWGISLWGGTVLQSMQTTTLNGALNDDTNGNNGSTTEINFK